MAASIKRDADANDGSSRDRTRQKQPHGHLGMATHRQPRHDSPDRIREVGTGSATVSQTSLTLVELAPLASPAGPGEGGTLELVEASGARLVLRLPNASPKDLLPMVQLFLRRRS